MYVRFTSPHYTSKIVFYANKILPWICMPVAAICMVLGFKTSNYFVWYNLGVIQKKKKNRSGEETFLRVNLCYSHWKNKLKFSNGWEGACEMHVKNAVWV